MATRVTHTYARPDGSEVRLVGQIMYGLGLHPSQDIHVLRREHADAQWELLSNQPAEGFKTMPVCRYLKHGRSPMLQAVSPGEILKVLAALDAS